LSARRSNSDSLAGFDWRVENDDGKIICRSVFGCVVGGNTPNVFERHFLVFSETVTVAECEINSVGFSFRAARNK
jgi:hypothetical protein